MNWKRMIIKRKVFSSIIDEETGEERLFSTTEFINEDTYLEQREYGTKSALLGVFAPGSYQAKEAAKYGYDDEEDYKKDRAKFALKGWLTPGTATYIKKRAEEMAREGKSKEEIRKYLNNEGKYHSTGRVAAGVAEALTGSGSGIGHGIAHGVGLYDKINKNRAKLKKKEYSEIQEDDHVLKKAGLATGLTGVGLYGAGKVPLHIARRNVAKNPSLVRFGKELNMGTEALQDQFNALGEEGIVNKIKSSAKSYINSIKRAKNYQKQLDKVIARKSPAVKWGNRASKLGAGLAIAGATAYGIGRHKDIKKAEANKKSSEEKK